jgi:hypothetical protein
MCEYIQAKMAANAIKYKKKIKEYPIQAHRKHYFEAHII